MPSTVTQVCSMTMTPDIIAKCPRICANKARAEIKHVTSSQLSTFIDQTRHGPSRTAGSGHCVLTVKGSGSV